MCRTAGSSLELLSNHCWNVTSLSLFYRYYFCRCSSKLVELLPLPFVTLIGCMIFVLLDVIRIIMSIVSVLAQLHPGILSLQNALIWLMIWMDLSLELIRTFNIFGFFHYDKTFKSRPTYYVIVNSFFLTRV